MRPVLENFIAKMGPNHLHCSRKNDTVNDRAALCFFKLLSPVSPMLLNRRHAPQLSNTSFAPRPVNSMAFKLMIFTLLLVGSSTFKSMLNSGAGSSSSPTMSSASNLIQPSTAWIRTITLFQQRFPTRATFFTVRSYSCPACRARQRNAQKPSRCPSEDLTGHSQLSLLDWPRNCLAKPLEAVAKLAFTMDCKLSAIAIPIIPRHIYTFLGSCTSLPHFGRRTRPASHRMQS